MEILQFTFIPERLWPNGKNSKVCNLKTDVKQITGIHTKALCEKYLGLPTAVGRSTKENFEHIPSRIKGLMGGTTGNRQRP
jgi:hypothetical protein